MTRFARAKGSKASNERLPEDATSWSDMKRQLLEKDKISEEKIKKQEADNRREKNYKAFLQEVSQDEVGNTKWAEFPTKKILQSKASTTTDRDPNLKPKKKKKKLNVTTQKGDMNEREVTEDNKNAVEKMNVQSSDTKKIIKKKTKLFDAKKAIKRKREDNKETSVKKVKKSVDKGQLPEEDLKKLEKKNQKRLRQLEKKKINKQESGNNTQTTKKQPPKFTDNKNHERRKKMQERMMINGREVEIAYVDGFPIKKEDADRIQKLRRQMISKGLPRSEIKIALKLERRKAEKAFAREKKKVCFNCRKSGHNLSECPDLGKQLAESAGTGICFKCGSTEHTHFECKVVRGQEFKYAQCFICHEQGHIARQCPDNARGLYPKGGACKVCGDVTHLKKDCPKYQAQQKKLEESVQIETMNSGDNPDSLGQTEESVQMREIKKPNKIIKF